jgi:hypothetical protein
VTYSTTVPASVAGGVQLNVQDVRSFVEKTYSSVDKVEVPVPLPVGGVSIPACALPLCVRIVSSNPPVAGMVTVRGTAVPPGV